MALPIDPRGHELVLLIERAKYDRFLQREVIRLLGREFEGLVDLITSRRFRALTPFEQARKLELFRELERRLREAYGRVTEFHIREMTGYADLEAQLARAQVQMLAQHGNLPRVTLGPFLPSHSVRAIAALPIDGLKLGDWFDGQARAMSLSTRRVIQNGLIEGKGPAEMIRQILPPRNSVESSVYKRARREATAITRTTVTAVQNHAAQESYAKLPPGVSDSYRIAAVRDSRTSPICRALDGRVYRYDDPKKRVPPFHPNCRSSVIAIVKGVPLSPMTFASYNDWLKAQNTSTQNEILGPTRAEWWRSGKMTLADAIDGDLRVLTLPQLRAKLGIAQ